LGRPEPDSVVSLGVRWATRVTSIGLEFALPPLFGGYLDRRWGLGSTLTVVGAVLGFLTGMAHILAIAREDVRAVSPPGRARGSPPPKSSQASDGSNAPESGWADDG
jgi:hypothetical protein